MTMAAKHGKLLKYWRRVRDHSLQVPKLLKTKGWNFDQR
uniref:Uncharacterized protein n=1 Tax=Manihot esculenta TaxID=3983 RepID=A0A2C9USV7_MANES